jgi:hypothetical protein
MWSLPIFWQRTGGIFSSDRDLSANAFYYLGEDSRLAVSLNLAPSEDT